MYTRHATIRCQQRGIQTGVVNAILEYGKRRRRRGADICYMDKAGRERAWSDMGRKAYAKIADRLHTYLVIGDDGKIITTKRFRRLVI
jgi:hypothetical protein